MNDKENFLSGFAPLPEEITLPPSFLETYEVESCLSRKERGGVWRLARRADGAAFVLKAVPAGTEDLAESFQILTRLWPLLPNSVPEPVSQFRAGEMDCLLRTYLPGETLAQRREREDGCSEALCVSLGLKLCALLEIIHSQNPPVIHRDIKPENIVILPDGEAGLIDFGIARQFKEGKDTDTRHMGTRSTAAPEQYGYAQTDRRTDLYALSMTLIWALTGRYDRDALQETEISSHLRKTLEKAAAFAPDARFQDAAAFAAALAGKPARRKRAVLALTAALLLLAAGAWFLHPADMPADESPGEAEEQISDIAVEFSSAVMEAAVRQALGKPNGTVTYDELSAITRLAAVGESTFGAEQDFDYRIGCYIGNQFQGDLPPGDVTDEALVLLAHMPNLKELYLCRQEIRDISVLEGLPLTTLALCENQIADFSPLAALTELETLYLGGNPGTDYSVLSRLDRLSVLTVEGSAGTGVGTVDSLDFLDALTLRKLGLGLIVPKDGSWEPLTRQIALEELLLWDPGDDAVAAASALSQLKTLTIGDYYASDLTALAGLTGLEVLNIHKGSMESLTGIQTLTRLITLSVGHNGITDLSPLSGLERLNYLQLDGLEVTDFSPLADLPALGYVVVPQKQTALVKAACPNHTFELRGF